MFVGTGSDVGKSVINAGFCRIFLQDGYAPAPFKAQNMSLNSYATPDGLEIGRAQAVQAEASGIPCRVEMNPVLLKPTDDLRSQVVLNGKPIGTKSASEYFLETDRTALFREAMKSFYVLDGEYNPVVIEGAGSISELNLWDKDITNMKVALESDASTYLIADIDRGGVFGSVYGTLELLPPEQKRLIRGILINKFRGDLSLFEDGRKILEELTGVPVVGIVPYFRDILIEQEDSVVLDRKASAAERGDEVRVRVGVVLLEHMANFTDFNMLEQLPEVHLFYMRHAEDLHNADIIIIPGSKNTIADLSYLQKTGIADVLLKAHKSGTPLYGICGGYQMMGREIRDPYHVESKEEAVEGLGILPVSTVLSKEKRTIQCTFRFLDLKEKFTGYEIHMGETFGAEDSPLCRIDDRKDGFFLNTRTWGTYIHGIFDNAGIAEFILRQVDDACRVSMNYKDFKEANYNTLAAHLREHTDLDYIYSTLG